MHSEVCSLVLYELNCT